MNVINRSSDTVTWIVWDGTDTWFWGARACEWIVPGQSSENVSVSSGGFKFYIHEGKWPPDRLNKFGRDDSRYINNSNATLLIQTLNLNDVVDWQSLKEQYIDGKALKPETKTSFSANAALASSSIKTVAEFMKFIPIVGTAFSGLLSITANLADTFAKGIAGTPQNDPLALISAIREVVRAENDRQTAENAASTFINGTNYLNRLDPASIGPHEMTDLWATVEDYCAPGRDAMNYLTSMNLNARKAMYIAPAYLQGVAAYLKFLWFHFLITLEDGDKLTPALLLSYKGNVDECKQGLTKLRDLVKSEVDQIIKDTKLTVNPELTTLSEALYLSRIGMSDLTQLNSAITDLTAIENMLDLDRAHLAKGEPIQYFFKSNWALAGIPAQPAAPTQPGAPSQPAAPIPSTAPVQPSAPAQPSAPR